MEYNLENDDIEEVIRPRVAGYRVLGVIFFLLAAGGLFIGALSKFAPSIFSPILDGGISSAPVLPNRAHL